MPVKNSSVTEWPKQLRNLLCSDNMIYEIADKCVKGVEKLSDNWEIYLANSESIEVESKKDILNFAKEEVESGVGIRIIKDGKIGFAFTSDLNKIPQTAKKALANAKLNKVDENYQFSEISKEVNVKGTFDKYYDDLSVDEMLQVVSSMQVAIVSKK